MRNVFILVGMVVAGTAAAQGNFGLKKDPISTPSSSSPIGMMPMVQMLIALGLVYVMLRYLLPKFFGKMNRKMSAATGSSLRIEESANFAGGSLYVVHAREKTLLLSVSTSGVTCLADLTQPEKPQPPTFKEMVEQELKLPEYVAGPTIPSPAQPSLDPEAESALRRLSQLTI